MKFLIVIPTYNEAQNIAPLISAIRKTSSSSILVVDDSSPDGTADILKQCQQNDPSIHLLVRAQKEGLGRAYVAGFHWGLSNGFDGIIEMDADFSHRPNDLIRIEEALRANDFVVGSRWVSGGGTRNWDFSRKVLSLGGSIYSSLILGGHFRDWTGGFNGWRKSVLEKIDIDNLESYGFSFQIELKYRAIRSGFKGKEVPIIFEERRAGTSKMSGQIISEGLIKPIQMRLSI